MTISLDRILGSWRLFSAWHEFETIQCRYPYDTSPLGSLVFTDDNRMTTIIAARSRVASASHDELFRTMEAYSGRFVLEDSELITTVDVAWKPDWQRTVQRRFLSLSPDGDMLFVNSPKQITSLYPGVPFTNALTWLRERTIVDRQRR